MLSIYEGTKESSMSSGTKIPFLQRLADHFQAQINLCSNYTDFEESLQSAIFK